MLAPDHLPTPLAQVVRRVDGAGHRTSGNRFLAISYAAEMAIKLIAISLTSSLRNSASEHSYRLQYELVRGDGLGTWDQVIREATSPPVSSFHPRGMRPLLAWLTKNRTKPEDDWYRDGVDALTDIFDALHLDPPITSRKPSVRDLISGLVQLRNKTKAHGAVGANFFQTANAPYAEAVSTFIEHSPLFSWPWLLRRKRDEEGTAGLWLEGLRPTFTDEDRVRVLPFNGVDVSIWPSEETHPISLEDLVQCDAEGGEFLVPNGGYTASGNASFIDYLRGREKTVDLSQYLRPPAPLPKSDTEGLPGLTIHSNVFGNLPALPDTYIERRTLQNELRQRLTDRNHPIITLHGRGGIGKTTLALKVAHDLAEDSAPQYEEIVWFSARDVDLQMSGPKSVRPAVTKLEEVARIYGQIFDRQEGVDAFSQELREPDELTGKGTLFIFDNFETMADPRGVHQFLDTHTHIPNKVLITSRERAFKADFPIEVGGMEEDEAIAMIKQLAVDLRIEPLATDENIAGIYNYAEGHPYVMKILVGEMAKDRRYVPPKTLMPRRPDILNSVFERSFKKLSPAGRWVFLLITNWRSAISETALVVVLAERGLDALNGIDECERLSLISRVEYLDQRRAFTAPQVARVFGQKKLEGDPDHLLVQEDLEVLQKFGVLPAREPIQVPEEASLRKFSEWAVGKDDHEDLARIQSLLSTLAEVWPRGWLYIAKFRQKFEVGSEEDIRYALRRAVEENPGDRDVWLERAEFARHIGDEPTYVASRIRAVELDHENTSLIRDVALDLCKYVSEHTDDIPVQRRSVYLASVRNIMEGVAENLDADGLSRLAWLHLLEGNSDEAREYASKGLEIDPQNTHCYKLVERLKKN